MRKHGFQFPLNMPQYLSASTFTAFIIVFSVVIIPLIPYPYQAPLITIYSFLHVLFLILYIQTTLINPTDSGNILSKSKHCSICNKTKNFSSKHCARCDRCTLDFDHHCKWVNNCIGKLNYRQFIALIIVGNLLCFYNAGVAGYAICISVKANNRRISDIVVIAGFAGLNFMIAAFLLHLVCFHMFLWVKHISTYEFIVSKRMKIGFVYETAENNVQESEFKGVQLDITKSSWHFHVNIIY